MKPGPLIHSRRLSLQRGIRLAIVAAAVTLLYAGTVAKRDRAQYSIATNNAGPAAIVGPAGAATTPASIANGGATSGTFEMQGSEPSSAEDRDPFWPTPRPLPVTLAKPVAQPLPPVPTVVTPAAPPLPFRFLARLHREGQSRIFIAKGDLVIEVKPDSMIDGEYRVGSTTNDAVSFTHLPTGTEQRLALKDPGASK